MAKTTVPARPSGGLSSWFRKDPFRALQQEMDDLFSRFSTGWDGTPLLPERTPSLDVAETDTAVEVTMDIPGIKPDEIDIEVSADSIRISGEHKEEKEEKGKTMHRIERRAGSFSRIVALPCSIDQENVSAESKDGVLTITLPKTEESKTKKITVKG